MILVVGDVMTDVIVRPEGILAPGTDRRATITHQPGGSGANIACWLGSLGVPVRFAGRVGAADHAAQVALLRQHGVEPHLGADPDGQTGTLVALVAADGERSFFTDRGANLKLNADDLADPLLEEVRALHISGHTFFTPGPRAAAQALMEVARTRQIEISVDAGSAGWLSAVDAAAFRAWTRGADVCFANADEAALVDGDAYRVFVVTRGAQGADARDGGAFSRVAAGPVVAHDSTGAGDAFAAGFLANRLVGAALQKCLRMASAQAALCVTRTGGRP